MSRTRSDGRTQESIDADNWIFCGIRNLQYKNQQEEDDSEASLLHGVGPA